MIQAVLIGAVAVLSVGGYACVRRQARAGRGAHSCRCPRCGQKLRYAPGRAGRAAACPACRHPLTLPSVAHVLPRADDPAGGYRLRRKHEPGREAGREANQGSAR